jgi:uroporphyrinogen-III synthase
MPKPRVLITRSPHQASELAASLRALNLEPILIPTIELTDPTTFAPLDAALANLDAFHWLVFTSANAVDAFHRRLSVVEGTGFSPSISEPGKEKATDPARFVPPRLEIASIGPATTRALEAIGLCPSLSPPQAVAESLAEALLPHTLQPDRTPTRFLLIRAETARDYLPETLRAAGADVTIAPAYRTIIPDASVAQIRELFSTPSQWPDAIAFTSSSAAANLQALLEASNLTMPPEILRVSIGPITSRTLQELELPAHAEAEQPTVSDLAQAVVKAFSLKSCS